MNFPFPFYSVPNNQCHGEVLNNKIDIHIEKISLGHIVFTTKELANYNKAERMEVYLQSKTYSVNIESLHHEYDEATRTHNYLFKVVFSSSKQLMPWLNLIKAFHKVAHKSNNQLISWA